MTTATETDATKSKYLWGSNIPFPFHINFVLMAVGCIEVATMILYISPKSQPAIDYGCTIESVRGMVVATVLYFVIWYQFLGHQVALKFLLNSTYETAHYIANRIVMNTLEQMSVFLIISWLFTIYIESNLGGTFGLLYVLLTILYGFAYTFYGEFTVLLEISTQPRYIMLGYMAIALLLQASIWTATNNDGGDAPPTLRDILPKSLPLLVVILFVCEFLWTMVGWFIVGIPLAKLNMSNNPNNNSNSNKKTE